MTIIVREGKSIEQVDPAWDKNRVEIIKAPTQARNLAEATCAVVRIIDWIGQEGVLQPKYKAWETLIDDVDVEVKKSKDLLKVCVSAYSDRLKQDINAAQAEAALAILRTRAKEFEEWYPQHLAKIESLPWPTMDGIRNGKIKLGVSYAEQPVIAKATGFQFKRGYIMTAAHAFRDRQSPFDWYQNRLYFRLHLAWNGELTWDSDHDIKRMVLRNDIPENQGVVGLTGVPTYANVHDVSILEIAKAKPRIRRTDVFKVGYQPFPPEVLQLSKTIPEIGSGPLGLLGHPHSVPLKYVSAALGMTSFPRVLARPDPRTPETYWHTTLIAADIDKFGGNSGGPLLYPAPLLLPESSSTPDANATKTGAPAVIGVVRSGIADRCATSAYSKLDNECREWLVEALTRLSGDWEAIKKTRDAFGTALQEFRIDKTQSGTPILSLDKAKPEDPTLKERILFNRVDVFLPFTTPISTLVIEHHLKVCATIWVWISSSPGSSETEKSLLQPTLSIADENADQGPEYRLGLEKPRPRAQSDDSKTWYRWIRYFEKQGDLNREFERIRKAGGCDGRKLDRDAMPGFGDIPIQVFNSPSGFCSWDTLKLEIDTAAPKGRQVEALLDVVFGYGSFDNPSTQIQFRNRLQLRPLDKPSYMKWIGYIGLRPPDEKIYHPYGSAWFGPFKPSDQWVIKGRPDP